MCSCAAVTDRIHETDQLKNEAENMQISKGCMTQITTQHEEDAQAVGP